MVERIPRPPDFSAAVAAIAPLILVIDQKSRDGTAHAQINQRNVVGHQQDQRPQSEFRLAQDFSASGTDASVYSTLTPIKT
jgi:hypothetical protein